MLTEKGWHILGQVRTHCEHRKHKQPLLLTLTLWNSGKVLWKRTADDIVAQGCSSVVLGTPSNKQADKVKARWRLHNYLLQLKTDLETRNGKTPVKKYSYLGKHVYFHELNLLCSSLNISHQKFGLLSLRKIGCQHQQAALTNHQSCF